MSNAIEDRVVNDQAYLLLYRRRDYSFVLPPVPIHVEEDNHPQIDTNINDIAAAATPSAVLDNNYFARSNLGEGAVGFSSAINNVDRGLPATNVVHVAAPPPSASAATVTTVFATSNANVSASFASSRSICEGSGSELLPHSNLNNMHIGAEAIPLGSSSPPVQYDIESNFDFDALEKLDSGDYNATSMINTNNAMCGNLVSNIHIDTIGPATGACKEATMESSERLGHPSPFGAVGSNNDDRVTSSSDFAACGYTAPPTAMSLTVSSFGQAIPLSSRILRSSGAGSDGGVSSTATTLPSNLSMFGVSTPDSLSVDMTASQSVFVAGSDRTEGIFSAPGLLPSNDSMVSSSGVEDVTMSSDGISYPLHESGSATLDSTPSDGGEALLDEATPMSVSSASQPSLSSTEEESISTAQEELD